MGRFNSKEILLVGLKGDKGEKGESGNSDTAKNLKTTYVVGDIKEFARNIYNNHQFYTILPIYTDDKTLGLPSSSILYTYYLSGYIYVKFSQIWIELTEKETNKVYRCNWVTDDPINDMTDLTLVNGIWSDWETRSETVDSELSTESENPVQNKVVTEALNKKLDKVTTTSSARRVYVVSPSGEQTTVNLQSGETSAYSVAMRDGSGTILLPDIKNVTNETNKQKSAVRYDYVHSLINSVKPYTHIVTITNESATIDITLTIYSYDNTPFDTASIYNGIMLGYTSITSSFEPFKSIITIYAEGTGYGNNIEKPNYSLWKDANLINIDTNENIEPDGELTVTDAIV